MSRLLFLLPALAAAQTVTITRDIPSSGHRCVRYCLFRPYNAGTDLGDALECGPPYEEDCFCPTAAPQAEIVSRHIDDCATESCSAGDVTADIESMRGYYASYCIENGYTADLVEEWYAAAEETASAEETSTTEEISTAEETTSGEETTAAETSTEVEETSTSTTTSDGPVETGDDSEDDADGSDGDDDGKTGGEGDDDRNPDGLPSWDDEEDAASHSVSRMGVLGVGLASLVAAGLMW